MSQLKKVLICVPDALLAEVDSYVKGKNTNRSEFVREAMRVYLSERMQKNREEQLKNGYCQMADINRNIAELCLCADSETLCAYEEKLAECE